MADRTLAKIVEPLPDGSQYTLTIDRSAAGTPGLFVNIQRTIEGLGVVGDATVEIEDGTEFLEPVIEWLGPEAQNFIEVSPEQAQVMLNAWYFEKARIAHQYGPPGQAARDIISRDKTIHEAWDAGIPRQQVERFVFGPPVSETPNQENQEQ